MQSFDLARSEASDILEELETAHHVIRLPGTQRILMANPFSALDTPFAVKISNKGYFGACAWDAVAFHIMLGRESLVNPFRSPIFKKYAVGATESNRLTSTNAATTR